MSNSRETREYPRFATAASVVVRGVDLEQRGVTTNVSSGGLCATLAGAPRFGESVALELRLQFSDNQVSDPLRIDARTVWATEFDDGFQVGFAFIGLDDEKRSYLQMFLRYLEANLDRS